MSGSGDYIACEEGKKEGLGTTLLYVGRKERERTAKIESGWARRLPCVGVGLGGVIMAISSVRWECFERAVHCDISHG